VRKAAQHAVCAILKGSSLLMTEGAPEHHPAASHVAKYLIQQIESGASTTTLHSLGLLKEVLATFPKPQLKVCLFCIVCLSLKIGYRSCGFFQWNHLYVC
jgi:ribosomal RNA-processing protein 12